MQLRAPQLKSCKKYDLCSSVMSCIWYTCCSRGTWHNGCTQCTWFAQCLWCTWSSESLCSPCSVFTPMLEHTHRMDIGHPYNKILAAKPHKTSKVVVFMAHVCSALRLLLPRFWGWKVEEPCKETPCVVQGGKDTEQEPQALPGHMVPKCSHHPYMRQRHSPQHDLLWIKTSLCVRHIVSPIRSV